MLRMLCLCAFRGLALVLAGGCGAKSAKNGTDESPMAGGGVGKGGGFDKKGGDLDGKGAFKKTDEGKGDKGKPQPAPKVGLLTAGSFDDNLFPAPFGKLVT